MQENQQIRVIRPDSRVNEGSTKALQHLASEIWSFRSHIRIVFKEQFRAASSGAGLGIVWNYVLPIIPLTVYILLGTIQVFPEFDGVDGTTYRAFGVTLWFLLAGCIQVPINIIKSRNTEVMKTALPLSAAIVSGFTILLFDTLVRISFVLLIILGTQSWPQWSALLLPIPLFFAGLLFIALGLLFGILNVIYNDVGRIVTIALQYGIFLSGVIFPLPHGGLLELINLLNPFAIFIDFSRSIVFGREFHNIIPFGMISIGAILLFLMACRLFYIMEYRIRDMN